MSDNLAIRIKDVSKIYRYGQIGGASLQQDLKSWWYKKTGKEDPNLKIGVDEKRLGAKFYALKDINLEVKAGEILGILGKNGAGKSTLLKLISRITAPNTGEIEIWGRIVSMLEVGTGFHQEMTGRENVYLNGAILGMRRDEITARMDDIIEFSEVGDFIDTPVKRYSSGMYVKLAFAVAAHLSSEIMIMDEVLAVGDVNFQNKCIQKMREEAQKSDKTVLYVSHNMDTIRNLCQKCIVLDKGRIIYSGDVENAIRKYVSVKSNMELSRNVEEVKRESYVTGEQKILNIGLDKNVVEAGDDIVVTFKCKSFDSFGKMRIRIEFLTMNAMCIGTAFSDYYSVEKDEEYTVQIKLKTSYFVSGRYTTKVVLCQTDTSGRDCILDRIEDAFAFDIETNDLIWQHRSWGSIRFEDMPVKKF